MPKAYILSHGARVGELGDTFVEAGRTLNYYADFDETALQSHGSALISAGDITPTETFAAGAWLPDYHMEAYSDAEIANFLASESSLTKGKLLTVGGDLPDNLYLCSQPEVCVPPTHAPECKGLFSVVSADDIHLLACRAEASDDHAEPTMVLGTESAHNDTDEGAYALSLLEHTKELVEWAKTDPQGAYAQYMSYPQGTKAALLSNEPSLGEWLESLQGNSGGASVGGHWLGDDLASGLLGNARPKKFEKAWDDDYWRNVFWVWFRDKVGASGGQEALLTLYDQLNDYYSNKSTEAGREIAEYCEGARGVVPACDAGSVQRLRAAVDAETGVTAAVDELWNGVVAQMDMVYPGFYEDVGQLKDAIR